MGHRSRNHIQAQEEIEAIGHERNLLGLPAMVRSLKRDEAEGLASPETPGVWRPGSLRMRALRRELATLRERATMAESMLDPAQKEALREYMAAWKAENA